MTTPEFVDSILTLGLSYPFSVWSWGRTEKHNKAVKGLANSYHLDWRAVDGDLDDRRQLTLFRLRANELRLQVVVYKDYLHLEPL